MNNILLLILSMYLTAWPTGSALGADTASGMIPPEENRILFIGVDGATWDMINPMIEEGLLPNFQALKESGSFGTLVMSEGAIFSPTVWTSMFTGVHPDRHGLLEMASSLSYFRRQKAVWNFLSDSGRPSLVINVPGTYPPEKILGGQISGFPFERVVIGDVGGEFASLEATDTPEAALRTVIEVPDFDTNDLYRFDLSLNRAESNGRYRLKFSHGDIAHDFTLGTDEWSPWLSFVLDGSIHVKTRLRIPKGSEEDGLMVYLSPLERLPDSTWSYYQLSDGFGDIGETLIRYSPLEIGWWRLIDVPLGLDFLYDSLVENERLRAEAGVRLYGKAEWTLFIQILTLTDRVQHPFWPYMDPQPYGFDDTVRIERYGDLVRQVYIETDKMLGQFLDPVDEKTTVFIASDHGFRSIGWIDIIRKSIRDLQGKIDSTGFLRGILSKIFGPDRLIVKPDGGMHDEEGIYIITGPAILSNHEGKRIRAIDIAPTLLYLLGENIPDDLDGRIVDDVITDRYVQRFPPRYIEGRFGKRETEVREMDPSAIEQLKSMGYIK
jgi:hypothetical protein